MVREKLGPALHGVRETSDQRLSNPGVVTLSGGAKQRIVRRVTNEGVLENIYWRFVAMSKDQTRVHHCVELREDGLFRQLRDCKQQIARELAPDRRAELK